MLPPWGTTAVEVSLAIFRSSDTSWVEPGRSTTGVWPVHRPRNSTRYGVCFSGSVMAFFSPTTLANREMMSGEGLSIAFTRTEKGGANIAQFRTRNRRAAPPSAMKRIRYCVSTSVKSCLGRGHARVRPLRLVRAGFGNSPSRSEGGEAPTGAGADRRTPWPALRSGRSLAGLPADDASRRAYRRFTAAFSCGALRLSALAPGPRLRTRIAACAMTWAVQQAPCARIVVSVGRGPEASRECC